MKDQLTLEDYVGKTVTGVSFEWEEGYSKEEIEEEDVEEDVSQSTEEGLKDAIGDYTFIRRGEVPSMHKITLSFESMPDLTLNLNDGKFGFVERKEVVKIEEEFTEICPNAAVRDRVYREEKPKSVLTKRGRKPNW